jgi:ankyrin repeat protein
MMAGMSTLRNVGGRFFQLGCVVGVLVFVATPVGFCEPATVEQTGTAQVAQENAPLWKAAQDGDLARIQHLLDAKALVDDQNNNFQSTPLMYAAGCGRVEALKLLLKAGARPDLKNNLGFTALWCASKNNHADCVKELLAAGADPDIPGDNGRTPLIAVARHSSPGCLIALLEKHPKLDVIDNQGFSALMLAAGFGHIENVQALVKAGADIDLENTDNETALIKAGQRGQVEVVAYLTSIRVKKTKVFLNECSERDPDLTPARRWALATVALSSQYKGRAHEVLAWKPDDSGSVPPLREELRKGWGIKNRDDLLKILDSLASASSQSREVYAWHLCHCISLTKYGFTVGFLNRDESWQKIMPIAKLIQRDFHSWEDLAQNYMAIDKIREEQSPKTIERYRFVYELLSNKNDPNSPWNINPWNTPLTP